MFLDPNLNELERPNSGAIGLLGDDGETAPATGELAEPVDGDAVALDELPWDLGALGLRADAKRGRDEEEEEADEEAEDEDDGEEDDEEFDDDAEEDFDDDEELDDDDDDFEEDFDDDDDDV